MSDGRQLNIPVPDPSLLTNEQFNRGQEISRREMASMREYLEEKIRSLKELQERTFSLFGVQIEQGRLSSKEAVEAALMTQREAAAKAEASTGKQLEALDRRISEIKERLDTGEGAQRGSVDTRQERRADFGSTLGVAALIVGVASILVTIVLAIVVLPHSPAIPVTVAPSSILPAK